VYDGRGSVAQTLVQMPGVSAPAVNSHAYSPFGEMLSGKQTGFGFNAEWYDAATGMQNLRVRQYEPGMMRFTQQDVVRGNKAWPLSLNRYLYVRNDPLNMIDPSGMRPADEEDAKAYFTGKVATAKAKAISSAAAKGKVANKQLDDWEKYCRDNYQYLPEEVRRAYDNALKGAKSGNPKDRARMLLAACMEIAPPLASNNNTGIYVSGNDKEKNKVVDGMQIITVDALMLDPNTGKIYVIQMEDNSKQPAGTELLRSLASSGKKINIIASEVAFKDANGNEQYFGTYPREIPEIRVSTAGIA
jgi:RHS repeat-associated protein